MQKQDPDLQKVKLQFAAWRRKRDSVRAAMPENLKVSAVELCKVYSIGRVCAELSLVHAKLKKMVAEGSKASSRPNFVSVELPLLRKLDPVCEWIRPDGARLRIRVGAGDLNQVVASFFGGQA